MAELPYYEVGGTKYPRVSRILSILREPQVEAWQAKTPDAEEQSREAKQLGTWVHAHIAADLRGQTWKLPRNPSPQLLNAITAYQAWKRECYSGQTFSHPVVIEQTFTGYGYGGTVDLVLDDTLVIDWKIAGAIRPKHQIQTQAYIPLVWVNPATQVKKQTQIIRLDKDLGIYEASVPAYFNPGLWHTFMQLKDVYTAWYFPQDCQQKQEGR